MSQKFFLCEHCKNIVAMVEDKGVPVICCGQKMKLLIPGEIDASVEKHVPAYVVEGNVVRVEIGEVEHPMIPEHYIEWVSLETNEGFQLKRLSSSAKPKVCFSICDNEEIKEIYAYCNIHGLWKKTL